MIKTDKVVYRARTREEYDWLMQELEREGCEWGSRKNLPSSMHLVYVSRIRTFLYIIKRSHMVVVNTVRHSISL